MKRPEFSRKFVALLRKRQEELGVEKYLINDVKFAFMVNIVHWIEDPRLLEIKREYKPRNKKGREEKKKQKATIKILSLTAKELTIEIKDTAKEPVKGIQIQMKDGEKIELELNGLVKKQKEITITLLNNKKRLMKLKIIMKTWLNFIKPTIM